jgi:COPII coat assembly protein SEC16
LGGAGQASSKAVLLGSYDPATHHSFDKDIDPFIFTEIAEFALSLAIQQRNQDTFSGLAHLQPYRLIRAYQLAEMGHTAIATRLAGDWHFHFYMI